MFQPQMSEQITPFLESWQQANAGAASGGTKKDMGKAAIRPYSDVKYCVGPRNRVPSAIAKRS